MSRASSNVGVFLRNCVMYSSWKFFSSINFFNSSIQNSSTYPDGINFALFSRKSPNEIKMSPKWRIFSISFLILIPCSMLWIFTTSPFFSLTIGVSIVSTNDTVAPLLGTLILTWVPTAIVWSKISAITGWNPIAENPVLHALPYLNLNPPSLFGIDRTERPVITSLILFAAASSSSSPVWTAPSSSFNHSQSSKL